MATEFTIFAGVDGGNFDDLIAYMGNPNAFFATSGDRNHIIFSESSGLTGMTVVVDIYEAAAGYSSYSLHLLADGGHVLLDVIWDSGFYLAGSKSLSDWERAFDYMMNTVQSATLSDQPVGLGFIGNDGRDILHGSLNSDTMSGGNGNDVLSGRGGNDSLNGGLGNESLFGDDGDDTLNGDAGRDAVYGGFGMDIIDGGLGDDYLGGGNGVDRLRGGGGADFFVFSGAAAAASGDRITDFSQATGDRIDLRAVDAMSGNAGLDHFTLISTGFTGSKGELRINQFAWGTQLRADVDGDGFGDFTIALLGVTALDASGLLLV